MSTFNASLKSRFRNYGSSYKAIFATRTISAQARIPSYDVKPQKIKPASQVVAYCGNPQHLPSWSMNDTRKTLLTCSSFACATFNPTPPENERSNDKSECQLSHLFKSTSASQRCIGAQLQTPSALSTGSFCKRCTNSRKLCHHRAKARNSIAVSCNSNHTDSFIATARKLQH